MKKDELYKKIEKLDSIIRKHSWFDMQVLQYDGWKLYIVGSTDLSYYHTLEIIFEDISFIKGHINGWKSDTSKSVFKILENEYDFNLKYNIEEGYQLFCFKNEDYPENNILIAAANFEYFDYSNDPILYYQK